MTFRQKKYAGALKMAVTTTVLCLSLMLVVAPKAHAVVQPAGGGDATTATTDTPQNCDTDAQQFGSSACSSATDCATTGSKCGSASTCFKAHKDLVACYVNPTIDLLSIIVGLAIVISVIIGGIQYSTSAGDPQKTAAAKGRITNAVLAFFAYAFLYAFLEFIIPGGIFNLKQ